MSGETTSTQRTSEAGPEGAKAADFTTANNPRTETHGKVLLTAACALGRDKMVPSRAQTHLAGPNKRENTGRGAADKIGESGGSTATDRQARPIRRPNVVLPVSNRGRCDRGGAPGPPVKSVSWIIAYRLPACKQSPSHRLAGVTKNHVTSLQVLCSLSLLYKGNMPPTPTL